MDKKIQEKYCADKVLSFNDAQLTGQFYANFLMETLEQQKPIALLVNHEFIVLEDTKDGFFQKHTSLRVRQVQLNKGTISSSSADFLEIDSVNLFTLEGHKSDLVHQSYPLPTVKRIGNKWDIQVIPTYEDLRHIVEVFREVKWIRFVHDNLKWDSSLYELSPEPKMETERVYFTRDHFGEQRQETFKKYFGYDPFDYFELGHVIKHITLKEPTGDVE